MVFCHNNRKATNSTVQYDKKKEIKGLGQKDGKLSIFTRNSIICIKEKLTDFEKNSTIKMGSKRLQNIR